jgi:hypothetical protein
MRILNNREQKHSEHWDIDIDPSGEKGFDRNGQLSSYFSNAAPAYE